MLDDPSIVVQPEDVDPSPIAISGPVLIAVQDDVRALSQRAAKLDPLTGVLARHSFEVFDERVLSVCDYRIMLRVRGPHVSLDGLPWTALVEHQIVKLSDSPLRLIGCNGWRHPIMLSGWL
jgi:hypothetical protein